MQFYVVTYKQCVWNEYPAFVLEWDDWDDWGFYATSFTVRYYKNRNARKNIGTVKIGQIGLKESFELAEGYRTPKLPYSFKELGHHFFSLGQDDSYYERLKELGDNTRQAYLSAMNDVAYNLDVYNEVKKESVMQKSLMRFIAEPTILGQFHRMARGGARLTEYAFGYQLACGEKARVDAGRYNRITFDVRPYSNPPTNIHVVIGRNGVGKTRLIKDIIQTMFSIEQDARHGFFYDLEDEEKRRGLDYFSSLVCIGFSAFDTLPIPDQLLGADDGKVKNPVGRYTFVGLDSSISSATIDAPSEGTSPSERRIRMMAERLYSEACEIGRSQAKSRLFKKALGYLEYDPIFAVSDTVESIRRLLESDTREGNASSQLDIKGAIYGSFIDLSAGHKIVLLTIACLVNAVEEKSFVLIDEPETHLHPPLLSALIRAISEVLIEMNGVAFIATHSPEVLQEVPADCCWRMQRSGQSISLRKLTSETFGTDINTLIRDVFGLEVLRSGFHQMITQAVEESKGDYDKAYSSFNKKLGTEGMLLLKAQSIQYQLEHEND